MVILFTLTAFITTLMFVIFNSDNEKTIPLVSKYGLLEKTDDVSKNYLAKRIIDKSGKDKSHWVYYNDFGDVIEDEELIDLIHSSFVNEDWYGDYIFYVNDVEYYQNIEKNINELTFNYEVEDVVA